MGFNFSVRKLVGGKLKFETGDYGIDTIRSVGDADFYSALCNEEDGCEVDVFDDGDDYEEMFVRPKDFDKARTLSKKIMVAEALRFGNVEMENSKRLLAILDKLEADPSLWLGGGR